MAAYTIEEIFNGNKYSVMSEVVKEILLSGPYESVHTAVASGSWCGAERQQRGDSGSVLI